MKLYRYDNGSEFTTNQMQEYKTALVFMHEYGVIKSTPCGSWIMHRQMKKWINHNKTKQFAYRTVEEAKSGFIHRKKSQIRILEAQLQGARDSLVAIESPIRNSPYMFPFE